MAQVYWMAAPVSFLLVCSRSVQARILNCPSVFLWQYSFLRCKEIPFLWGQILASIFDSVWKFYLFYYLLFWYQVIENGSWRVNVVEEQIFNYLLFPFHLSFLGGHLAPFVSWMFARRSFPAATTKQKCYRFYKISIKLYNIP